MKQSKRLLLTLFVTMVSLCINATTSKTATFDFTSPSTLNPYVDYPTTGAGNGVSVNGITFTSGAIGIRFDLGNGSTWSNIRKNYGTIMLHVYEGNTITFFTSDPTAKITTVSIKYNVSGKTQSQTWKSPAFSTPRTFDGDNWIISISVSYTIDTSGTVEKGLLLYKKLSQFPDGVTVIGANAVCFENEANKSIEIPSQINCNGQPFSVVAINESALHNAVGIESVTIPDSVVAIGDGAFRGCSSLTSINLPSNVTSLGTGVFADCTALTEVELDAGITTIPDSTFYGCTALTSIQLSENYTSIGNHVFDGCSSLASVQIPQSYSSIGNSAFKGCSSLTSIKLLSNVTSLGTGVFADCTALTNVKLTTGITSIPDYTFQNCTALTSIQIPSNYTTIGNHAFDGCTGLETFTIPSYITSIGTAVFENCTGLKSFTIPQTVTSIGNLVFANCTNLETIEILGTFKSSGVNLFNNCTKLSSAKIGATESGTLFKGFTTLRTVELTDDVKTISDGAFSGCQSLEKVVIGSGVTRVGSGAFYDCPNIKDLYSKAITPPTCGASALDDIDKSICTLYVYARSESAYQSADQWKDFYKIKSIEEVTGLVENTLNERPLQGFYDLQGHRVQQPQRGQVYIRKMGGRTEKVLVK